MNGHGRKHGYSIHRHQPPHRPPADAPPGNTHAGLSSALVRNYVVDALKRSLPSDITNLLNEIGYNVPLPSGQSAEELRQRINKYLETEPGRKHYETLLEQTVRRWLQSDEGVAELRRRKDILVDEQIANDKEHLATLRANKIEKDVELWLQSPQGQEMLEQARRTAIRKQISKPPTQAPVSWIEKRKGK